METQPQITFENIDPSDFVRGRIENEVSRLEETYGRITACRVVISKPEKGHGKRNPFQIRIHMTLPGGREVAVRPSTAGHQPNADAGVAIRKAFDAARRQLKSKVTRMRGQVKTLHKRIEREVETSS